jgi:hypothetical protein
MLVKDYLVVYPRIMRPPKSCSLPWLAGAGYACCSTHSGAHEAHYLRLYEMAEPSAAIEQGDEDQGWPLADAFASQSRQSQARSPL